jgi:hypothetical protein
MKNIFVLALVVITGVNCAQAQKYKLDNGVVDFYSYAPMEDIKAKNSDAIGIIDTESNKFTFRVNIKEFIFPSELMQEHFNENYLESEKYPTSSFKGNIDGDYDLKKDGTYNVVAKGEFTIHGVTKTVEIPGTITVAKKSIQLAGEFKVKLADYEIEIPTVVFQKIAELIDVKINSSLVGL